MAIISKLGLWRWHSLRAMSRYEVERVTGGDGFYIQTPIGKFHCLGWESGIQFSDVWEPRIKELVTNLEGKLFVDVGANIGYYSVMAARKNKVVAVEPYDKAFNFLLDNITLNGLGDKIEPHHYAAWSETRDVHFMPGRHGDTGKVHDVGPLVQAMPLDVILDGRIPALIKIDTEGSEAQILRGMPDTLAAHPRIIFEALSQSALKACFPYLADYHIERLDRTNYLAS